MHDYDHLSEKPNKYVVLIILVLSLGGLIYIFSKPAGKDVVGGTVKEVLLEREILLSGNQHGSCFLMRWSFSGVFDKVL